MLQHGEVRADAKPFPQLLLEANRPVRATPDDVAETLGEPHHRDGDDAGGIADFQRTVDVEADESARDRSLHDGPKWILARAGGACPAGRRCVPRSDSCSAIRAAGQSEIPESFLS